VTETLRQAAGRAVLDLMTKDDRVVALAADTLSSMSLDTARSQFSERVFDVGIAEQTMVTMAAGLAIEGYRPYVATYSNFLALRCCEQIRSFVAYQGVPVHFLAGLGGLSAGIEGVTHLATEDVAIMSTIPGLRIVCPSSGDMTYEAIIGETDSAAPVYYRLGREETGAAIPEAPYDGLPIMRRRGGRCLVLSYGWILEQVLAAVDQTGVPHAFTVVEVPRLRPLPGIQISALLAEADHCVVVEEGTVRGGLGTLVCELAASTSGGPRITRIGVGDEYLHSGTPRELYEFCGLDAAALADTLAAVVKGG
jgi:transketolase